MLPDLFAEEFEQLGDDDFLFFQEKVFQFAGISLSGAKKELVRSRLKTRLRSHGLKSLSEYRQLLERLPPGHEEWQDLINRVTTNKTEFFREPKHFQYLESEFIPEWKRRSVGKPLSVWCAASSTGEEPYTLAIVLRSLLKDVKIKATDIDTEVLAKARNGVYPADQLDQIPVRYRSPHFENGRGDLSNWMRVHNAIRETVRFEQLNLTKLPYALKDKFDLIFCRNVLIYFSKATVHAVTEALYAQAKPGAILVIGHSESLNASSKEGRSSWEFVRPSIYRKAC